MYKDPDKQREANREASKKRRVLAKRNREGMTTTLDNVIPVTPSSDTHVIPKRGYQMTVMERLFYRPAHLLKPGETNFISLPGRACYGVV